MKQDKTLIILVGLPRSGKSTIACQLQDTGNAMRLNADTIRYNMYGENYIGSLEPYVWAEFEHMYKYLLQTGINICIDNTNIKQSNRETLIKSAKEYGYKKIYEFFIDTPMETCFQRAMETGKEYLLDVIARMEVQILTASSYK